MPKDYNTGSRSQHPATVVRIPQPTKLSQIPVVKQAPPKK